MRKYIYISYMIYIIYDNIINGNWIKFNIFVVDKTNTFF